MKDNAAVGAGDAQARPMTLNEQIIRFYEEAGIDYGHWSRNFNMHFGFYRPWHSPFDREGMLEQMNAEVLRRLQLHPSRRSLLLDLGCGVGATSRHIARARADVSVKGITNVPWQVEKAAQMNARAQRRGLLRGELEILLGDYTALPFADATADGVWAVESTCHAEGASKARVIGEMARVLKPGGRFVVADCFLKNPQRPFHPLMNHLYHEICRNWLIPEMASIDDFVAALQSSGMRDIVVEDVSWRIAPSVMHAPFAVVTFMLRKARAGQKLKNRSVNNLKGSLLSLFVGMNRSKFSYCLISGTRA